MLDDGPNGDAGTLKESPTGTLHVASVSVSLRACGDESEKIPVDTILLVLLIVGLAVTLTEELRENR